MVSGTPENAFCFCHRIRLNPPKVGFVFVD